LLGFSLVIRFRLSQLKRPSTGLIRLFNLQRRHCHWIERRQFEPISEATYHAWSKLHGWKTVSISPKEDTESNRAHILISNRNTVKAKGRDRTARIQKDFFGKQKMNILSRGLVANTEINSQGTAATTGKNIGVADISLAHARQKIQLPKGSENIWIPEPYSYSSGTSSSPRIGTTRTRKDTHSAKSNSKAKILKYLDQNERKICRNL
jgi:hypothetical protein